MNAHLEALAIWQATNPLHWRKLLESWRIVLAAPVASANKRAVAAAGIRLATNYGVV